MKCIHNYLCDKKICVPGYNFKFKARMAYRLMACWDNSGVIEM